MVAIMWPYFNTLFSTCIKFSMFFNLALIFYQILIICSLKLYNNYTVISIEGQCKSAVV